jgi:hypothetical protein
MIAGPANFPVARMEKKNRAIDNKRNELIRYYESVPEKIIYDLKPDHLKPVKTGQANAVELLQTKLEKLKAQRDTYKEVNKIIRKKALTRSEKIAELKKLGYQDPENFLIPDYAGRTGVPSYSLTNIGAEIRRLEARLQREKSLKEKAEKGNSELTFDGGSVVNNFEMNRLQLFFDDKPGPDTRTALKKLGFKWAPSQGAWQRHLSTLTTWHKSQIKEIIGPVKAK